MVASILGFNLAKLLGTIGFSLGSLILPFLIIAAVLRWIFGVPYTTKMLLQSLLIAWAVNTVVLVLLGDASFLVSALASVIALVLIRIPYRDRPIPKSP